MRLMHYIDKIYEKSQYCLPFIRSFYNSSLKKHLDCKIGKNIYKISLVYRCFSILGLCISMSLHIQEIQLYTWSNPDSEMA